jgi:hypothetical protein
MAAAIRRTPGAMPMKRKSLVVATLLLCCGSALAGEQKFAPVEVRPSADNALAMSCGGTTVPNRNDVERVLQINDRSQTFELGSQLVAAVGEACNAGVENIVVQRGASGRSVTWAPASAEEANVAIVLNPAAVAVN